MCTSPIYMKNPNKGRDPTKGLNFLKDCTSEYIYVNCGKCPECIALEQMYMVQRIQMESLKNWLYMGTITYKNEMLPILEIPGTEYRYRYARYKDIQDTIKRMKQHNVFGIPFRQIIVSERGSKRARPHFHILFLFRKEDIGKDYLDCLDFEQRHKWDLFNEWKVNVGSDKKPIYKYCCDYRESFRAGKLRKTYDFHFVDPRRTGGGITDAAFYVLKYMLKGSKQEEKIRQALQMNYEPFEYKEIWETIKSREKHSLGFGLNANVTGKVGERVIKLDEDIINYLRDGVQRSKLVSPYAQYYAPENLLTFPLGHYYKAHGEIYNVKDALDFYYKNDGIGKPIDNYCERNKNVSQSIKKWNDYERKLETMRNDEFAEYMDELFN